MMWKHGYKPALKTFCRMLLLLLQHFICSFVFYFHYNFIFSCYMRVCVCVGGKGVGEGRERRVHHHTKE